MRIRVSFIAVILAGLPLAASAQTTDTPQAWVGTVDFGVRNTSGSGDLARYERYRDMSDGLFMQTLQTHRESNRWLVDFMGKNVGRCDQRLQGTIQQQGRVRMWGLWDQIPMLMSNSTQTLFLEDLGKPQNVLTINDALQRQVQTSVQSLPNVFAANAITFETSSKRSLGQGGVQWLPNRDLTINGLVQYTRRTGSLPYGVSFGHSNLVEAPAPIDHRIADLNTNAEYTHGRLLVRGGVTGSWFTNEFSTLTVDNPFRIDEVAGTPSHGALSLAPSNSFVTVNGMASIGLAGHSRGTAYVSFGSLQDTGNAIMAQTVNTVNLPLIKPLPRATVDGSASTRSTNLTFVSHPKRLLDIDIRYRMYDYTNDTPEFIMPQRVAYDATPAAATYSTLGGPVSPLTVETEPLSVKRQTLDADIRLTPGGYKFGAAGVGYSMIKEDRAHRFFEGTTDQGFHATYDIIGSGQYSMRAKYEYLHRRGDASEEQIDEAQRELFNIGEQPVVRHFDIADRNRNRITILGSVMATQQLSFSGSAATGKDDFIDSVYGLRDNTHHVYTAGMDAIGTRVNVNLSYSYERYAALLHSHQANPPATADYFSYETYVQQFGKTGNKQEVLDVTRDWGNEGVDRVHSILAGVGVPSLFGSKLSLNLMYDYNRARALYTYTTGGDIPRTLPEDTPPPESTLPPPSQLPPVKSDLERATADALYALTSRIGIGVTFWYERYSVEDWTLDIDANSNLARPAPTGTGGALLLGYMYQPYNAKTVWVRLVAHW